jgi:hypothetical protein
MSVASLLAFVFGKLARLEYLGFERFILGDLVGQNAGLQYRREE